jgi:hypothetical protein
VTPRDAHITVRVLPVLCGRESYGARLLALIFSDEARTGTVCPVEKGTGTVGLGLYLLCVEGAEVLSAFIAGTQPPKPGPVGNTALGRPFGPGGLLPETSPFRNAARFLYGPTHTSQLARSPNPFGLDCVTDIDSLID